MNIIVFIFKAIWYFLMAIGGLFLGMMIALIIIDYFPRAVRIITNLL